jgi:hypothetical protein
MKQITAAYFLKMVEENPNCFKNLEEALEITEYVNATNSKITHLSEKLVFSGVNEKGECASFQDCKALENAAGIFKGAVDFDGSNISNTTELRVTAANTFGYAARFSNCPNLKIATGDFPGSVNYSGSGVEIVKNLRIDKPNHFGTAIDLSYLKNVTVSGVFPGTVNFYKSKVNVKNFNVIPDKNGIYITGQTGYKLNAEAYLDFLDLFASINEHNEKNSKEPKPAIILLEELDVNKLTVKEQFEKFLAESDKLKTMQREHTDLLENSNSPQNALYFETSVKAILTQTKLVQNLAQSTLELCKKNEEWLTVKDRWNETTTKVINNRKITIPKAIEEFLKPRTLDKIRKIEGTEKYLVTSETENFIIEESLLKNPKTFGYAEGRIQKIESTIAKPYSDQSYPIVEKPLTGHAIFQLLHKLRNKAEPVLKIVEAVPLDVQTTSLLLEASLYAGNLGACGKISYDQAVTEVKDNDRYKKLNSKNEITMEMH